MITICLCNPDPNRGMGAALYQGAKQGAISGLANGLLASVQQTQ